MQATAGIEPQIDMLELGFIYARRTLHTQPVALGGRLDSNNGAAVFLVDFHAIATDILIALIVRLSATIKIRGILRKALQSAILRWHLGTRRSRKT
jgi:hypothetical protein